MENVGVNTENRDVKGMNVFQKIIGIIVAPTETMREIAAKPKILLPMLWVALGTLTLYIVRFPLYQKFLRSTTEAALAQQNQQITPEQLEAGLKFTSVIGLVATPFSSLVIWLVGAAVLFGLVKLFKGEGRFVQFLAINGYAYVISLLYTLLCLAVSFFTNNLLLDSSLANITNLFIPDIKGSYLYGIIRSIDLFSIWGYVVLGIGMAVVSKLSKAKVYSVMGIMYIGTVLLQAYSMKNM